MQVQMKRPNTQNSRPRRLKNVCGLESSRESLKRVEEAALCLARVVTGRQVLLTKSWKEADPNKSPTRSENQEERL